MQIAPAGCKASSFRVYTFIVALRPAAAVVVLSIFLSGALSASGLCGGHPAEDQHEGVSQVIPATALGRAEMSERDVETANPGFEDGCCDCCRAEQSAVLQRVLPREKSTQNESIVAPASTELLIHDQAAKPILGPMSSHPPPGMEPCSSILRV